MILYSEGKLILNGSVLDLCTEASLLLKNLREKLEEREGKDEAKRLMEKVFDVSMKTPEELETEITDLLTEKFGKEFGKMMTDVIFSKG